MCQEILVEALSDKYHGVISLSSGDRQIDTTRDFTVNNSRYLATPRGGDKHCDIKYLCGHTRSSSTYLRPRVDDAHYLLDMLFLVIELSCILCNLLTKLQKPPLLSKVAKLLKNRRPSYEERMWPRVVHLH